MQTTMAPAAIRILRSSQRNVQSLKIPNKRHFTSTLSSDKAKSAKTMPKKGTTYESNSDPHHVASEMVRQSGGGRGDGIDALSKLSSEQKMKNYVMALSLVGFCTGVWYYSIQSVGKSEGVDDLIAEAEEAKMDLERKNARDRDVQDLAELDVTMSQLSKDGSVGGDSEIIVAIAADEEIAQREEEINMTKAETTSTKVPTWKRVVFFWRRN